MQHISRMWLWVNLLFTVCLLISCETKGTSVAPVFKQTGDDLLLDVDADVPEGFSFVEWNFNKTVILVRFAPGGESNVFPDFTGRIEFPEKNFSVKLKNLQKADSGVYTAQLETITKKQQLAEYKVTVQDPVSPVELTVDPDTVSRSSDSCNLTATCRTQNSNISSTFRCVHRACSQEGGERSEVTTSGASLQVTLLNSSIICNHSNQVNWAKDFKMIDDFCPQYPDPGPKPNPYLIPVIVTIVILIVIILLGLYFYRRRTGKYERENNENTIYENPQVATTAQPQDGSPTDDASGPTSTYSMVGPHTGPLDPSETRSRTLPESLYATVEKHTGSFNNS